jgi:hypothetical protein
MRIIKISFIIFSAAIIIYGAKAMKTSYPLNIRSNKDLIFSNDSISLYFQSGMYIIEKRDSKKRQLHQLILGDGMEPCSLICFNNSDTGSIYNWYKDYSLKLIGSVIDSKNRNLNQFYVFDDYLFDTKIDTLINTGKWKYYYGQDDYEEIIYIDGIIQNKNK